MPQARAICYGFLLALVRVAIALTPGPDAFAHRRWPSPHGFEREFGLMGVNDVSSIFGSGLVPGSPYLPKAYLNPFFAFAFSSNGLFLRDVARHKVGSSTMRTKKSRKN